MLYPHTHPPKKVTRKRFHAYREVRALILAAHTDMHAMQPRTIMGFHGAMTDRCLSPSHPRSTISKSSPEDAVQQDAERGRKRIPEVADEQRASRVTASSRCRQQGAAVAGPPMLAFQATRAIGIVHAPPLRRRQTAAAAAGEGGDAEEAEMDRV